MDNQENLEELQEFDLEAILSEFHDDPEGAAEEASEGPVSPTLPSLDEEAVSDLQEAAEVLEAADTAFEEDLSDLLGDLGDLSAEETAPGAGLEDTQIFEVTPTPPVRTPCASVRNCPGSRKSLKANPFPSAQVCGNCGKRSSPDLKSGTMSWQTRACSLCRWPSY